jgi:hypothetical protein
MSSSDYRRPPRVQTLQTAILIDSDGGELPVEITNLSSGGFRLRSTESLVVGESVCIRVSRHGDFPAQIQWVEGLEAGGRFSGPITL